MTSTISNDTSPLADLVDTARICVATAADVQPITIRNAGLVLREVIKRLDAAKLAHKSTAEALSEAHQEYHEAVHLLMVSALQPNGGEA